VDREEGGYLFFLYEPCNPRWILEYEDLNDDKEE